MGCCGGRYAGIALRQPDVHLVGYSGIVLVEYSGTRAGQESEKCLFADVRYRYGTDRPRFYVDARSLSRLLAWQENGERVFSVGLDDPLEVGQADEDAREGVPVRISERSSNSRSSDS